MQITMDVNPEDAALGGGQAFRRLFTRASLRQISKEDLQNARRNADETGRLGEELVNSYLVQLRNLGELAEVEWISQNNAVVPFDFRIRTLRGEVILIEAKTTTGEKEFTDVLTPEQRSWCMSRIKGKNTKPELSLRKALWDAGMRYRLGAGVFGRPDVVFKSARVAVFVDGCFWHRCPQHGVMPKKNGDFWRKKIKGNIERDRRVDAQLQGAGWKVLRFWEHEVKSDLQNILRKIKEAVVPEEVAGQSNCTENSTALS